MFLESPRFPTELSFWAVGGPGYNTTVVVTFSGWESRNANWEESRYSYELNRAMRIPANVPAMQAFFHVVKGRHGPFRMKDFQDYSFTSAEGRLGTGAIGTGMPTYQTYKRYTSGAGTTDRKISKLVSGTFAGFRNASPITIGAAPGNISVDVNTGIISFVADASVAITGHTPGASHVFTTATDPLGLGIGGKVYIAGASVSGGTDVLNGVAHTISNKTGAGPFTWTISTNTTGLTVSGGTAYKYPQPADILTASGEFDVPVRFDVDTLSGGMSESGLFEWNSIPIVEVRL